jgi:RimJ/RimL family protein N-acetyltransferase
MFTHTDLNRIEAYHSTANPQSGRVMAKAGMIKEGFARQYYKNNDGYQDSDLYGIIRNNWEENKNV